MSNTPERDERYRLAERVLEDFLARPEAGDGQGASFEALVAAHADLASELRELFGLCGEVDRALEHGQGLFAAQQAELARLLAELRPAEFQQRYRIDGEVGKGGMGAVYRAVDRKLERPLAMKVILGQAEGARTGRTPPLAPRQLARFLNEAKITGQLDHPGIVPVHEVGVDDAGRAYFTMKLVKGRTLAEVFAATAAGEAEWSTPRVLAVLQRVCEALAFAHSRGVIHRDLKPANVMVGDFGEVYVMDWGLARRLGEHEDAAPAEAAVQEELSAQLTLTREGQLLGTPAYMSPEQASGQLAGMGPPSDVYAIGAMLYQLIAGHPPYAGAGERPSGAQVIARLLHGPPRALDPHAAPPELISICSRAMARAPGDRYPDTGALAADLSAYLDGRVVRAHEAGAWAEAKKWVRRNRGLAAASGAAVFLLIAGLVASLVLEARAERNAKLAMENAKEAQEQAAIARTNLDRAERGSEELRVERDRLAEFRDFFLRLASERATDLKGREEESMAALLERAKKRIDSREGTDPVLRGMLLQFVGRMYSTLGEFGISRPLLEEAHRLLPNDYSVLRDLGSAYASLGLYQEQAGLQRRGLLLFSGDEQKRLELLCSLGGALVDSRQGEEAKAVLEEALQLSERLGTWRLSIDRHLARLATYSGDLDAELEAKQKEFERAEEEYGAKGRDYYYSADNLGNALARAGRVEEAERYFRIALEGMSAELGDEHIHTSYAQNNLGLLLMESGRLDEALPLLERAADTRIANPDADPRLVFTSLGNLLDYSKLTDSHHVVETKLTAQLSYWLELHGVQHDLTLRIVSLLGDSLLEQKRHAEFREVFESIGLLSVDSQSDGWSPLARMAWVLAAEALHATGASVQALSVLDQLAPRESEAELALRAGELRMLVNQQE